MTVSVPVELQDKVEKSTVWQETSQWCAEHARPIWAEFLSTAMLLFLGCMSCVSETTHDTIPAMYSAWGFGMTVLFNIQIFGHISGAQMNPAVTITSVIRGYTTVPIAVAYIIAQCLGSTLGYYLLTLVSHVDMSSGICVTVPVLGLTTAQGLGIEIGITVALCLLCCASWDPVNSSKQDSSAVKFGLAIAGLSIIAGPLTGASMNPARSLGPAIVTGIWTQHYIYWVGPLVSSVLAPLLYKVMNVKSLKD